MSHPGGIEMSTGRDAGIQEAHRKHQGPGTLNTEGSDAEAGSHPEGWEQMWLAPWRPLRLS